MLIPKRTLLVGCLALAFSGVSLAQEGQDRQKEAKARLEAKQAAKKAAATQPTTLTNEEVEALQREIIKLRAEVNRLTAENAGLYDKVREAKAAAKPKPAGKSINLVGMTLEEAKAAVRAEKAPLISAGENGEIYRLVGEPQYMGTSARTQQPIESTPYYTVTVRAGKVVSFSVQNRVG